MITLDQVEQLIEESGVGYELAAWALKEANGNMAIAKEYVEKAKKNTCPRERTSMGE